MTLRAARLVRDLNVSTTAVCDYPLYEAIVRRAISSRANLIVAPRSPSTGCRRGSLLKSGESKAFDRATQCFGSVKTRPEWPAVVLLRTERLQVCRNRLHITALQSECHPVHHGHVAHVVLKGAQLLHEILHMLAGEPGIVIHACGL